MKIIIYTKTIMHDFSLKTNFNQNGVLNSTDKEASQPYLRNREAYFQEASLSFAFWDKFNTILQIVFLSMTILYTVGATNYHR
jgi:hypothetical protein